MDRSTISYGRQYDSVFYRPDRSACIVHCSCDIDSDHGELSWIPSDWGNEDEDAPWYEAETMNLTVISKPNRGLKARIKRVWNAIFGYPEHYMCISLSRKMVGDLGRWLLEKEGEAITLGKRKSLQK